MRLCVFVALIAFVPACRTSGGGNASPSPTPSVSPTPSATPTATPLPLGSVSSVPVSCPAAGNGVPAGATCSNLTITCPGVPDIVVEAAVSEPSGAATGTVAMLFGGGGTTFFDQGFPAGYLGKGLRVVQFQFATEWPLSPAGILAAACRPATAFRWAFDVPHAAATATAFCVHGHSGGSGALGETLAHYGGRSFIDYAVEDAGPVFGRIDKGCAAPGGPTTRYVCPQLPNGPFNYVQGASSIDAWEGTSSCSGAPSPADLASWYRDSVVTSSAELSFPQTLVHFWFCANNPNEASGQGSFFADAVTSSKVVTCITGSCSVEPAWTDPTAKQQMIDTMGTECLPRH